MITRLCLPLVLVSSVAACGSSSGGGGGDVGCGTSFCGFSKIPADGVTDFEGQTFAADYTQDLNTGEVTMSNLSSTSNASAQLTTENGDRVALSVSGGGSNASFDTRLGDTRTTSNGVVTYESANGQDLANIADEQVEGYEYQTYGAWATGLSTGSGTFGVGSYGLRTSAANIPVDNDASYSGKSVGIARRADGQAYATVSNINVGVDVARSEVRISSGATMAENLNTPGSPVSAPELDFIASGNVQGRSNFSAALLGTGIAGSVQGQFYGPKAEEVGGTFSASGTGASVYTGAFGAN